MSSKKQKTQHSKPKKQPGADGPQAKDTAPVTDISQFSFVEPELSVDFSGGQNFSLNVNNDVPQNIMEQNQPAANMPPVAPITPDIGPDPSTGPSQIGFEPTPYLEAVDGIRFDFAFGYRIKVPKDAPKESYEIRIFDLDSGMQLATHLLKRDNFLVGDAKFFVRYRLEIWSEEKLLFKHDYDCAGKRVYIVIPDGGLGDNLAWLPMAELFRMKHKADVCCVMGEWMIRLAGDLYPGLHFIQPKDAPPLTGAYANYFCGIFAEDHKNWRPIDHQLLGMQGSVESILGLPQGPVKCRLHLGSQRPFPEPYVCISSLGTNPGKNWNFPDGWNEIIRFLKSYGYRVLDIDRDAEFYCMGQKHTIPSEAENFTGRLPLQERINLLEHADFFIGLPSGLSWLAWNTNIPCVMISGFTMPNCEFPTPYRVTNYLFCHGCWNDSGCFFDQKKPIWCPRHSGTPREIECTKVITPKMVRETIMKIPAFQERVAQCMDSHGNILPQSSN